MFATAAPQPHQHPSLTPSSAATTLCVRSRSRSRASIRLLGRVSLPVATAAYAKDVQAIERFDELLADKELLQFDGFRESALFDDGWALALAAFPTVEGWSFNDQLKDQRSILVFRSVAEHVDDWEPIESMSPAFVQVVLHGKASVVSNGTQLDVRRGDVFAIDVNHPSLKEGACRRDPVSPS